MNTKEIERAGKNVDEEKDEEGERTNEVDVGVKRREYVGREYSVSLGVVVDEPKGWVLRREKHRGRDGWRSRAEGREKQA